MSFVFEDINFYGGGGTKSVLIAHASSTIITYLCLVLEGGEHGLEFRDFGLQKAALSEKLEGQLTALFWPCVLLPVIWKLALQLLDTIVIDEVMGFCSDLVLLQ
jgi:hypothetical protein